MEELENNNFYNEAETKYAIKQKRLWLIVNGVFLLVCLGLLAAVYLINRDYKPSDLLKQVTINSGSISTGETEQLRKILVRRVLDGVEVEPAVANKQILATMIENHIDSRPPSALSKASLVFEAEAEGGITRFLAVYADVFGLEKIGPIRSARPYYVDWAKELNSVYVHCGGSPEALVKIMQSDNVTDLNEFYNAPYFWRAAERSAPHNVYTSGARLTEYLIKKNITQIEFEPWLFKDDAEIELRPEQASTTVYYRGQTNYVDWIYNNNDNNYTRYMGGEVHSDADGSIIKAKNIVIQYAPASVLDEKMRLEMKTIGTGKAIICLDGVCREGTWKKNNESSRTRYYYNSFEVSHSSTTTVATSLDNEVMFNAGTTWIEVARPEIEARY